MCPGWTPVLSSLRGGRRGPGPACPTPVLCTGLGDLSLRRRNGHPQLKTGPGILRPVCVLLWEESAPILPAVVGAKAPCSIGLSWREGGRSSGRAGGGPLIHLKDVLGPLSGRYRMEWKTASEAPVRPRPLLLALWPLGTAGPPGNEVRDGHKGVLVPRA